MSDGPGANPAESGEANSNVRDPSSVTSTESGEASVAARDSSSVTQTESEETNNVVRDSSSVATHGSLGPQAQGTVVTVVEGSESPEDPDRDARIATAKQLLTYVDRVCDYQVTEEVRQELETIYIICEKSIQAGPALEHEAMRIMDKRLEELESHARQEENLALALLQGTGIVDPNKPREPAHEPSDDEDSNHTDSEGDSEDDDDEEVNETQETEETTPEVVVKEPAMAPEKLAAIKREHDEAVSLLNEVVTKEPGKVRVVSKLTPRFPSGTILDAVEKELLFVKKDELRTCPCGNCYAGRPHFIKHFSTCQLGVRYACPVYGCTSIYARSEDMFSKHIVRKHKLQARKCKNQEFVLTDEHVELGSYMPTDKEDVCSRAIPTGSPYEYVYHRYHAILRAALKDGIFFESFVSKRIDSTVSDWAPLFQAGPHLKGVVAKDKKGPLPNWKPGQYDAPAGTMPDFKEFQAKPKAKPAAPAALTQAISQSPGRTVESMANIMTNVLKFSSDTNMNMDTGDSMTTPR